MPAHDGRKLYDQQDARPSGPQAAEGQPEQPIPLVQPGARVVGFADDHLLPQGGKLKSEVVPRTEECAEPGEESQEELGHPDSLHDGFDGKMVRVQVAHFTSRPDFEDTQVLPCAFGLSRARCSITATTRFRQATAKSPDPSHSHLSAVVGSTLDALRAGK